MTTCAEKASWRWRRPLAALVCVLVAACGGGGGGGGIPTTAVAASTTGAAASAPAGPETNQIAISVGRGTAGASGPINVPYVSVTLCPPGGTSACQTIDRIVLDTGSTGLRLMASALRDASALPSQLDDEGHAYAECAQFAFGYLWGSVRKADISLGGKVATSVAVQVIDEADSGGAPASCTSGGPSRNSVAGLGGNGLLGVGLFRTDCGAACAANAVAGTYYICPDGQGCAPTVIGVERQVGNPVSRFASDNNGVVVQLPAIAATGAADVKGELIFGIGTRANNGLAGAQVYGVDAAGTFSTVFNGRRYDNSFVDSGSNFLFLATDALPVCNAPGYGGFYCPSSPQALSAVNIGRNGTSATVNFSIANAAAQLGGNLRATAFDNIGASFPTIDGFDWGVPFFFGRRVFTAFEAAATAAGNGPYIAY